MMAAALAVLSAIWKGLRAIPWQVYAVAALAIAVWAYGHHQYSAGVADENARWTAAQAAADRQAKADEAKRNTIAASTEAVATHQAQQHSADTRNTTATAVQRVQYVTRTIRVPADCPALPDSVRDEGRAAVERANAAAGPLRAGQHP